MVRLMNFIYSLAFLAAGFLGLTGLLPIFITYPVSANIGAIVLGALGLLIMIFVRRSGETVHQRREHSKQSEENVQLRNEMYNQSKEENEQLKREIDQLKKENERQRIMVKQQ